MDCQQGFIMTKFRETFHPKLKYYSIFVSSLSVKDIQLKVYWFTAIGPARACINENALAFFFTQIFLK